MQSFKKFIIFTYMGLFTKTKIYKIYLNDEISTKGVITLTCVVKRSGNEWRWSYSPDMIDPMFGSPTLHYSMMTDDTLFAIADNKIDMDNLENNEIGMGMLGNCKVKRIK